MEVIHHQQENKKITAGVMALIFGPFGIHKFILGYNKEGIFLIIASLLSFGIVGELISVAEGIIYLTRTDEDFYHVYQLGKKPWF